MRTRNELSVMFVQVEFGLTKRASFDLIGTNNQTRVPEMDDVPQSRCNTVFVSHSSADRRMSNGKLMSQFINEFRELICAKAAVTEENALFYDEKSIRIGDDWDAEISKAVRTAKSLICLVSPRYLVSVWCGRELEVFRRRNHDRDEVEVKAAEKQDPKKDPKVAAGYIFPLVWEVNPGRKKYPLKLSQFQFPYAEMPKDYEELGLRGLISLRKTTQMRQVAEVLSKVITEKLATREPLPEALEFEDFDTIPNALVDEPVPYDVVPVMALRNGKKWKPPSVHQAILSHIEKAATAMKACVHSQPTRFDPPDFERLRKEKQIVIVFADAQDSPEAHSVFSTLNEIPSDTSSNVGILLIDLKVVPGRQPRSVLEWMNALPNTALQQAIREQRTTACFVDGLQNALELLITRIKLKLLESAEGTPVIDQAISERAAEAGIPIEFMPNIDATRRDEVTQ